MHAAGMLYFTYEKREAELIYFVLKVLFSFDPQCQFQNASQYIRQTLI